MAELLKNSPAMWETWVQSLGWEHPVEKGTATHSSILALENSMDYTVHGVAKSRTKNSPNILGVLLIHIRYCVEKTNINNLARVYMVELMNSWVLFVCVCVCVCFSRGWSFLGSPIYQRSDPFIFQKKFIILLLSFLNGGYSAREWQHTATFLAGNSHGWRILTGYSPWCHKESDRTEWLSAHIDLFRVLHISWSLCIRVYVSVDICLCKSVCIVLGSLVVFHSVI